MNFACAQLRYRGRDVEPGIARVESNVGYLDEFWRRHELGGRDIGLLALGEFWLPSPAGPTEYPRSAVEVGGAFLELLASFTHSHDCYLMANIVERVSDMLFDSSVVVSPDGDPVLVYREIASGLMPESPLVSPVGTSIGSIGDTVAEGLGPWIPTVDTDLGRLGSVVGSDLLYPELSIGLTLAGVDVLLHPCKETPRSGGAWQSLKPARAVEGGYAIVSCNVADSPDHTRDNWSQARGRSRILDAAGTDLAASETDDEDIVFAEIDLDAVREQRRSARFDRRSSAAWVQQLRAVPAND